MVDLAFLADEPVPAAALVVGGLLSLFIAIYGRRDDSYLDEVGTFLAFLLGGAMLVMAYAVWAEDALGWFSLVLIIVLALTLFLKPLKEIPWSALLGVIAGGLAAFGASLLLPSEVLGVQEWIVLLIIFIVVGAIVHGIFHFLEDVLTIATLVVGWTPTMVLVGLVAVAEGVLLLMDRSISTLL
jgi:hypothetical protein